MRVDVVGIRTTLHWSFHLDEEDGRYTDVISMVENKFTTQLPKGVSLMMSIQITSRWSLVVGMPPVHSSENLYSLGRE